MAAAAAAAAEAAAAAAAAAAADAVKIATITIHTRETAEFIRKTYALAHDDILHWHIVKSTVT